MKISETLNVSLKEVQFVPLLASGREYVKNGRLRSHWQKHSYVAYCLYGSKRNMMIDLFADSNNPFYKFGDMLFLQKISRDEWVKFIVKRFNDTGKLISEDLAGILLIRWRIIRIMFSN